MVGGDGSQTEWVERNGNKFYFSFITSGAVAYPKYDDLTQTLSLTVRQPFPEKGFVNFMFTQETGDEKFTVKVNGNPIEFLQSKDPQGSWHVSFNVPQRSVSNVEISGFGAISSIPEFPGNNSKNYLLIAIPIAADCSKYHNLEKEEIKNYLSNPQRAKILDSSFLNTKPSTRIPIIIIIIRMPVT